MYIPRENNNFKDKNIQCWHHQRQRAPWLQWSLVVRWPADSRPANRMHCTLASQYSDTQGESTVNDTGSCSITSHKYKSTGRLTWKMALLEDYVTFCLINGTKCRVYQGQWFHISPVCVRQHAPHPPHSSAPALDAGFLLHFLRCTAASVGSWQPGFWSADAESPLLTRTINGS